MTDPIDLINRFMDEETGRLENMDQSKKPGIVAALEDFADDQMVNDFLFRVVLDEAEYDLARIEVLKIFEVKDFATSQSRIKVGDAIQQILLLSKDDDVRNYAAMAGANYMDIDGVSEVMSKIVLNPEQPSNLRWNAFAAIRTSGASAKSLTSLQRLLKDDEFQKSARRVLSEWQQNASRDL